MVASSFGRTFGRVHGHSAMQIPQDAASDSERGGMWRRGRGPERAFGVTSQANSIYGQTYLKEPFSLTECLEGRV